VTISDFFFVPEPPNRDRNQKRRLTSLTSALSLCILESGSRFLSGGCFLGVLFGQSCKVRSSVIEDQNLKRGWGISTGLRVATMPDPGRARAKSPRPRPSASLAQRKASLEGGVSTPASPTSPVPGSSGRFSYEWCYPREAATRAFVLGVGTDNRYWKSGGRVMAPQAALRVSRSHSQQTRAAVCQCTALRVKEDLHDFSWCGREGNVRHPRTRATHPCLRAALHVLHGQG
jgi:hypothetical protein